MRSILIFITVLLSPQAFAQYRCIENGKTVLTNRPCAGEPVQAPARPANIIGDVGSVAYSTTTGAWRGQVQFMAKRGAEVIGEAHAVVPFVIEIDAGGKVSGISSEAGCAVKGIAMPGMAATITNLDVTLSGCRYAGYNRQLTGRLALFTAQRYADINLVAYSAQQVPPGYFEIKGTLRR